MAEAHATKKKKKGSSAKRVRKERRYVGEQTYASKLSVASGMLGCLALGAGVYGRWISETPLGAAPYLLAGGGVIFGGALLFGDLGTPPVRVGDVGIAVEDGREVERVAWCDLESVTAEAGKLVIKAKDRTLAITIAAQPQAVARILAEGTRRVPEAMNVKRETLEGLPTPREDDGELLTVESLQVAGRTCAASGKTIAFERDARLCPQCSQVYLKERVPKKCLTCKSELGDRAVPA